jgi:hypothetical protein
MAEKSWREYLSEPSQARASSDLLFIVRAFIGPTFVIGGWGLVPVSFIAGICIVYVGFAICLVECIWEPALIRGSYQRQVVFIGVIMFFVDLFYDSSCFCACSN